MHLEIAPKNTRAIKPTAVLQQTAFWAAVKERQGWSTLAFDIEVGGQEWRLKRDTDKKLTQATDDMLVMLRRVQTGQYIAYVPYGPVIEPEEELQGAYLEELSEALRLFLPPGCILIRYDLRWKSHWAEDNGRFDENNCWIGPPAPEIQEMRMNFNTRTANLRKTLSDNLPSNTLFIDLKKDDEELLRKMKPKTRYNISLSRRKGVHVKDVTIESLPVWYELYRQTARRNGVFLHSMHYFKTVLETRESPQPFNADIHLLLASADEIPLAAMFLATSGGRATYLYGASASHHRNYMGSYALQWAAIRKAKQAGCTEYDFFGVAQPAIQSHPLYGLYRFKTGFGGYFYRRMGCWDYPLLPAEYEVYRAAELSNKGYHYAGS